MLTNKVCQHLLHKPVKRPASACELMENHIATSFVLKRALEAGDLPGNSANSRDQPSLACQTICHR